MRRDDNDCCIGTSFVWVRQSQRRCPATARLTFRPLAQTVEDTLSWLYTLLADRPYEAEVLGRQTGMAAEREAALLQHWHAPHS